MVHMKQYYSLIFCLFLLVGCTSKPTHPSLVNARLPGLIPMLDLTRISEKDTWAYTISPDGKKIAWVGISDNSFRIYFKRIDEKNSASIYVSANSYVKSIAWARDSRRIIYQINHIYMIDTEDNKSGPFQLTPDKNNIDPYIHSFIMKDEAHVLIGINDRYSYLHDLYKIDIHSGKKELVLKDHVNVEQWITDEDGEVSARIVKGKNSDKNFEVRKGKTEAWESILTWKIQNDVRFIGMTENKRDFWILTNINADKLELVKLDSTTGHMTRMYKNKNIDIEYVKLSQKTHLPLFAATYPDYQEVHYFDSDLEQDLKGLDKEEIFSLENVQFDDSERRLVYTAKTDKIYRYYLYDRDTKKNIKLGEKPSTKHYSKFTKVEPISFKNKKGDKIRGYISYPKGTTRKNLPMVVWISHEPWKRFYWERNFFTQILTNRGYVVLMISPRGSSGYGLAYSGISEERVAKMMIDDYFDGVKWAIMQDIADPDKICVVGNGLGGTLALTTIVGFPDMFTCGVCMTGVSDPISLIEAIPKSHESAAGQVIQLFGDPRNLNHRPEMENLSPYIQREKITSPLLIIDSDQFPSRFRHQSKRIIQDLKSANLDARYVQISGNLNLVRNLAPMYNAMDLFLRDNLGGRKSQRIKIDQY